MNLTLNLQRVIQMHMMKATDVDMMMDGLEENILVLILQEQVQAPVLLQQVMRQQQVQALVQPLVVDQQQQVQAAALQVEVTYTGII
jgi:hypothetical protein